MIETHHLSKLYGRGVYALRDLSLAVGKGDFVFLTGPSGAGKSTLFQVLTSLFVADAGEVQVAGHSLRHAAVRALAHIGVVFQQMSLDLDLSVRRNLQFHADLHGLPKALAREHLAETTPILARIEARLIGTGKRPWLIMAPSALRDCHLYLTLHLIFADFGTGGPGTAEWESAQLYHHRYDAAWAALNFPQASPVDGQANGPKRRPTSG